MLFPVDCPHGRITEVGGWVYRVKGHKATPGPRSRWQWDIRPALICFGSLVANQYHYKIWLIYWSTPPLPPFPRCLSFYVHLKSFISPFMFFWLCNRSHLDRARVQMDSPGKIGPVLFEECFIKPLLSLIFTLVHLRVWGSMKQLHTWPSR